ncbi:phosphate signaling complex protein PhoU [Kineosporia sp. J2-2]|uniref:Phosphate-specific transport system accessory protein PhoU n=1 Tax=Kineosporia corallincola TaxID=2835133 RepID=A0ABS5TEY0_9ACTN|nr:phosphate signaling complex protein PhoU [Kineosporia corallincola]MBT0769642.1 phosphate signaling complex protein PhoU [Kineosporia corallincola]
MPGIRHTFEADLHRVDEILLRMCELAGEAAGDATASLAACDVALAQRVIDGDPAIDALHHELEERLLHIIARRAPVATDLRMLLAALRVGADLERMGDLARHVAKLVRMRYPRPVAPGDSRALVLDMGSVAVRLAALTHALLESHDIGLVNELIGVDDRLDHLHRTLLSSLLEPDWEHGVEPAVDLTLIARFYERYGDHTVTIAHQVQFIVTGSLPEPRPREVAGPARQKIVVPR